MKTEEIKLENNVPDNPVIETIDRETDSTASNHSDEEPCSPTTPQAQAVPDVPEVPAVKSIMESSSEKDTVQNEPETKTEQSTPGQEEPSTNESDSSDLDDSDKEEKEYFDDSTEERFLKQTPGCGDSDSDSEDDFFIGKVRQTKWKKSSKRDDQVKKEKLTPGTAKSSGGDTEEQTASTGPKKVKLESVFCTSLAETKPKSWNMKR